MITYAQNFEDVMLERALKSVSAGTYIDVGAWHPEFDSVTRHFYERGWSGINIEPVPAHYELFRFREKTICKHRISEHFEAALLVELRSNR